VGLLVGYEDAMIGGAIQALMQFFGLLIGVGIGVWGAVWLIVHRHDDEKKKEGEKGKVV
jgi:hypothetical protein